MHTRMLWLPVLLGVEPWDWADLLVRCGRIVRLLDDDLDVDAAVSIDDLAKQRYRWTMHARPSGTVRDYVLERVQKRADDLRLEVDPEDKTAKVIEKASRYIVEANASDAESAGRPDLAWPVLAIRDAVVLVVR